LSLSGEDGRGHAAIGIGSIRLSALLRPDERASPPQVWPPAADFAFLWAEGGKPGS
jgi:hypothetical protein